MSRTTLYMVYERKWGETDDRKVGMYASEARATQLMDHKNSWQIRRSCEEMIRLRGPMRGHGVNRFNELISRVQKGFYYIKKITTDD